MKYIRPKYSHEDNLKLELAKQIQSSGIMLHMEYSHQNCRFDAVAVRSGNILAIIETKNWHNSKALQNLSNPSKQLKKYLCFGVPVYVLWSFRGIKGLVKKLNKSAADFDKNRRLPKSSLVFYPWPKKPTKKDELKALIGQQKADIYADNYINSTAKKRNYFSEPALMNRRDREKNEDYKWLSD